MNRTLSRRHWDVRDLAIAAGVVLVALPLLLVGCGGSEEALPLENPSTTIAAASATSASPAREADSAESLRTQPAGFSGAGSAGDGSLFVAESSLDRKVVSNASLSIEVERDTFQTSFDQAVALADTYDGYVVSSDSTSTGDETRARSGTVSLRIPSRSFTQALTAAGRLGSVKSQQVESQDVTEEYVDLQARLTNAQAQEKAYLALMERAKTVDEILQVRQVLSQTQQEIEQLKGRLRFLDEHTSYSTLVISLYETGVEVASVQDWGVVQALRDAVHGFVESSVGILVGLARVLPALFLVALIMWGAYRLVPPAVRRRGESSRRADAAAAGAYGWTPHSEALPGRGDPERRPSSPTAVPGRTTAAGRPPSDESIESDDEPVG